MLSKCVIYVPKIHAAVAGWGVNEMALKSKRDPFMLVFTNYSCGNRPFGRLSGTLDNESGRLPTLPVRNMASVCKACLGSGLLALGNEVARSLAADLWPPEGRRCNSRIQVFTPSASRQQHSQTVLLQLSPSFIIIFPAKIAAA